VDREIAISEKRENIDKGCIKIDKNQLTIFPEPSLAETFVDKETALPENLENLEENKSDVCQRMKKQSFLSRLKKFLQVWIKI
jgi:hypothetical protein